LLPQVGLQFVGDGSLFHGIPLALAQRQDAAFSLDIFS
jgi:hypothetical protein